MHFYNKKQLLVVAEGALRKFSQKREIQILPFYLKLRLFNRLLKSLLTTPR